MIGGRTGLQWRMLSSKKWDLIGTGCVATLERANTGEYVARFDHYLIGVFGDQRRAAEWLIQKALWK